MPLSQLLRLATFDTEGSEAVPGDNGLFGGQLQPCVAFLLSLSVCCALDWYVASAPIEADSSLPRLVWGTTLRLLALCFFVALLSMRKQLVPLAGTDGLWPAPVLARRIRSDFGWLRRWLHFPSPTLWLGGGTDAALLATCDAGATAALLAFVGWPRWLLGCWAAFVSLATAVPVLLYPWDCLLMEAGFVAGLLAPPLLPLYSGGVSAAAPPSSAAAWTVRLLCVRLVLGMGKFKFSRGWRRACPLYLKYFMTWQPLPTPLARYAARALSDGMWAAAHDAMFVAEVLLPAAFVCEAAWLRAPAVAATAALQLGIHAMGNFGLFNILTVVLMLPLLAPPSADAPSTVAEAWAAGALQLLGLLQFAHSSYTTNAWPFAVPCAMLSPLPLPVRLAALAILAVARLLAPLHLVHGYGVFTPLPLRMASGERRVVTLEASSDGAKTWRALPPRWYVDGGAATPTRWFAPHQPRLDHHLFYVGMGIELGDTTLCNPYYAGEQGGASPLPRLAHRLLHGSRCAAALLRRADVESLLEAGSGARPTHVRARFSWVRLATAADPSGRDGGAWVQMGRDCTCVFARVPRGAPESAWADDVMRLRPLGRQGLPGWWAGWAGTHAPVERRAGESRAAAEMRAAASEAASDAIEAARSGDDLILCTQHQDQDEKPSGDFENES